ncbi:unnamed protein product [Parnassius mnemosyne]|uniref:Uncharacterized protein n=1 Tax=Parnassius mnemosyne TaxID=213953 RepID=A0AAV1MC57_9NEOP
MMWTEYLPTSVRAVLAVTSITQLDKLAELADKIMKTTRPIEAAEIVTQKPSTKEKDLAADLEELRLKWYNYVEDKRGVDRNEAVSTFIQHQATDEERFQDDAPASDVLLAPPETKCYDMLKNMLMIVYAESENKQFQRLF